MQTSKLDRAGVFRFALNPADGGGSVALTVASGDTVELGFEVAGAYTKIGTYTADSSQSFPDSADYVVVRKMPGGSGISSVVVNDGAGPGVAGSATPAAILSGLSQMDAGQRAQAWPRSGGPRIAVVGNSLMADAYAGGIWTSWGWVAWARRYLGRRVSLWSSGFFAVGGATFDGASGSNNIMTQQLPQVAAGAFDEAWVDPWRNSLGLAADVSIGYGKTLIDTLLSRGIRVVMICPRVTSGANVMDATTSAKAARISRWLSDYAGQVQGLEVFDPNPLYADYSTGAAAATYLRDGLHDNQLSAEMMGRAFAAWRTARLPAFADVGLSLPGDAYDAANNPTGNLLLNGFLSGAAGTIVNGGTGVSPTNWRGGRSSGAATHSATLSIGTDATYPTLPMCTVTFGGTADTHAAFMDQERDMTSVISVGDLVYAEMEVAISVAAPGFRGVALQVRASDASFAILTQAWDGYLSGNGNLGAISQSMLLRTNPILVPAGFKYVMPVINFYPHSSGTPSGSVTVRRAAMRKVV